MNTYLAIITTVLVATQIIRLVQNAVQLRRQGKYLVKQIESLPDITDKDVDLQKKAYQLTVEYLEHRVQEKVYDNA